MYYNSKLWDLKLRYVVFSAFLFLFTFVKIIGAVEGPAAEGLGENYKTFQEELSFVDALVKVGKEVFQTLLFIRVNVAV